MEWKSETRRRAFVVLTGEEDAYIFIICSVFRSHQQQKLEDIQQPVWSPKWDGLGGQDVEQEIRGCYKVRSRTEEGGESS